MKRSDNLLRTVDRWIYLAAIIIVAFAVFVSVQELLVTTQ